MFFKSLSLFSSASLPRNTFRSIGVEILLLCQLVRVWGDGRIRRLALGRISDCHRFFFVVAGSRSSPAVQPLPRRARVGWASQAVQTRGKELTLPKRMGLTVLPSSCCSQRLITWPEYEHLAPYAFFFSPFSFSNNSERFYKQDLFLGVFKF